MAFSIRFWIVLLLLFVFLVRDDSFGQSRASYTFYVGVGASGANRGDLNNPFQSFDKLIEVLKQLKGNCDIVVYVRGGNYYLAKSLNFGDALTDSTRSILVTNYEDEKVVISGGIRLHNEEMNLVTDSRILNRLPSVSRGNVYCLDLNKYHIVSFGKDLAHGYKLNYPSSSELFYNAAPMTIARWPNVGLVPIGKVIDHGSILRNGEKDNRGAKFYFNEPRMNNWTASKSVWVGGYFSYGFSDDYLRVDTFDFQHKIIYLKDPSLYGVYSTDDITTGSLKNGQSKRGFYIYNLLEEIDSPGEWFLDKKAEVLYFWPPDNQIKEAEIELSLLSEPILVLIGASNVTFKGIEFAYSCGMGILLDRTQNVHIKDCSFVDLGTVGISLGSQLSDKGVNYENSISKKLYSLYNRNFQIESSIICNTGTGGILLVGGERRKLIPGNNVVYNCEIYNYSRIDRTYCAAISLNGVGNQVRNCYIHDAPDVAIIYYGNNHVISFNHIQNVVSEVTDAGAVCTGRDLSSTGNEISFNYFDNIKGKGNYSVCAVYLDDGSSGMQVNSNVFYRCGSPGTYNFGAIHVHGGGNNYFINNYFVDCPIAFSNTPFSDVDWRKFLTNTDNYKQIYVNVDIRSFEYAKQYPFLLKMADTISITPRMNFIQNTLAYQVQIFSTGNGFVNLNTYLATKDPGFVDMPFGNFGLINYPVELNQWKDWKPIPFSEIGFHNNK